MDSGKTYVDICREATDAYFGESLMFKYLSSRDTKENDMDWNKLFAVMYPKTEDFILIQGVMTFDQETFAIARLDSDKFLETARIIDEAKKGD